MRLIHSTAAAFAAVAILGLAPTARADVEIRVDTYRNSHRHGADHRANRSLHRLRGPAAALESATDRFKRSFDHALDVSRLNGTQREDRLNRHAQLLEAAADRLKDAVYSGRVGSRALRELDQHASVLDSFVDRRRLHVQAERDWVRVERELRRVERLLKARNVRNARDIRIVRNDRNDRYDRYDRADRHDRNARRDRDDRHDRYDRRDREDRRRNPWWLEHAHDCNVSGCDDDCSRGRRR